VAFSILNVYYLPFIETTLVLIFIDLYCNIVDEVEHSGRYSRLTSLKRCINKRYGDFKLVIFTSC